MSDYSGPLTEVQQEELTYAFAGRVANLSGELEIVESLIYDWLAWACSDPEMRGSYFADTEYIRSSP